MARLLLIKSGNIHTRSMGITPPLGIMYLASYARQKRGDESMLMDLRFAKEPLHDVYNAIINFKPDVVGISAITLEAELIHHISRITKKISKSIPVIVGGPHATTFPEKVLADERIDIAVIGEGEETFVELLNTIEHKGSLGNVNGIAYKEDGVISYTASRPFINQLDALPFPAWDKIDMEKYAKVKSGSATRIRPYMVLFTSRGCPFRCTYCHNIFGKHFRARSPENVLEEINTLIEKYGIKDFEIMDDTSNFDKVRLKKILSMVISLGKDIKLSFPNGIRADIVDEELIKLMRQAGTDEITIAIESASPRIQQYIKKNLNLERANKAIDMAVNAGMFVKGNFMLGFPTETEEEIKATIDFACNSRLHVAAFFIVVPFEGTELALQMEREGKIRPIIEYKDYDYYAMPFNGSAVSDKRFFQLYRHAYVRFYANPARLLRILKAKPMWRVAIPMGFRILKYSLFKVKGNKAIELDEVDKI
ncbi:MAG: B12-binding domain-containing radical SAM protein [bacterium]